MTINVILCVIFAYLIIGFTIAYFAVEHIGKTDNFAKRWEDYCKDASNALNMSEDRADTFGIVILYIFLAIGWGYIVPKVVIKLLMERRK